MNNNAKWNRNDRRSPQKRRRRIRLGARDRERGSYTKLSAFFEQLEARLVLAAVHWDGGAGTFNWTDNANWVGDMQPGAQDDVQISDSFSDATIVVTSDVSVRNLLSMASLKVDGSTFSIGSSASLSKGMELTGGTISGGALNLADGSLLGISANSSNRLLDVTVHGDLNLEVQSARVKIEGSTTFSQAHLMGNLSSLGFGPGAVLTGSVLFEGPSGFRFVEMNGTAGVLTVGPSGVIRTAAGFSGTGEVGRAFQFGGQMTLVNQGVISSEIAGRTVKVSPISGLTNSGTLRATGGGTLEVEGDISNYANSTLTGGTWSVGGASTLRVLGANITTNAATIVLDGANANFYSDAGTISALEALSINADAGHLSLRNAASLNTGSFVNSGDVTIGIGSTLNVTGSYQQSSSAALNIALAGLTPAQFGRLIVSNQAALDGTLNALPVEGFAPVVGDEFQIVDYASRSGTFATVNGVNLSGGLFFRTNYASTSLTLETQVAIVVTPVSGLVTTESGASADFSVALASQPSANVTIGLSSSNPAEGSVSVASLQFTPANWNVPRTVTVTGVDDAVDDGDVAYSIVTAPAVSADPTYSGVNSSDVFVTNQDDDVAGILVDPVTGLRTAENGEQATFTIRLISQPTASVTVALSSSDTTEGAVSPLQLMFTPINWNVPQVGTITGVDDFIDDGDVTYSIVTTVVSGDPRYNVLPVPDLSVTNTNDDHAGVNISQTQGLVTTEDGGTAEFTVVLNSQPTANVTIGLTSSDTTEGTVSPSSVTFTVLDWNEPRIVSVAGVDDSVVDGAVVYRIDTSPATSADPKYHNLDVPDVTVTNSDNDHVVAGIGVTPTSGLVTTEAGEAAAFSVVLTSPPLADVTFALASNDTTEGTVLPATLTFTATSWSVPQVVTVTGVNDAVVNGNVLYSVTTGPAVSADPEYHGLNAPDVAVTNVDDDTQDLIVQNLRIDPVSVLQSGGAVTVAWSDSNAGNASTSAAWTDRLVVVNRTTGQTIVSVDLPYDLTQPGNGNIAAGGSRSRQFSFVLPNNSLGAGELQVSVSTDAFNSLLEVNAAGTGESNNTAVILAASRLADYADLQVTGLSVTPGDPQSGQQVTIHWSDTNTGNGATAGSWHDHVVVTNTATGSTLLSVDVFYDPALPGNGPIAARNSRLRQIVLTLPRGDAGTGELLVTVTTDHDNDVFEYNTAGVNGASTAEINNVTFIGVTSALSPYADIVTSNVSAPAFTLGDPATVTVSWKVTNEGTGSSTSEVWNDTIVAVSENNAASQIVLARFAHQGAMAVGESYARTETFSLPPGFNGRYQLYVRSDADDVVFENGRESNNIAEAAQLFDVSRIPYADLIVSSVFAQPAAISGGTITVSWQVANQGIAATDGAVWSDSLYLASDPAGQNPVQFLGNFDHTGALGVGGSYTRQVTVALPQVLSGTFYAVVMTGGPFEFVFTDNNRGVSEAMVVTQSDAPDLTVSDIAAPGSAAPGGQIDVSWTVQNLGPGNAVGRWADVVYLRDPSREGDTLFSLGTFVFDGPLGPGRSYTRSELVTLPPNHPFNGERRLQGAFQIVVVSNSGATLFENGRVENNRRDDDAVIVVETAALPLPDLQVSSISSPASVATGSTFNLSFDVVNRGASASTVEWKDRVYLSVDDEFGLDDVELVTVGNSSALRPNGQEGDTYRTVIESIQLPPRSRSIGDTTGRVFGDLFLIVFADVPMPTRDSNVPIDAVDEDPLDGDFSNQGGNNILVRPLHIFAPPPSDLVTSAVVAPTQVFAGSSIEVRFTVTNHGAAATDVASWTDSVWLTRDKKHPRFDEGDVLLGTFSHNGLLAVGDSYQQVVTVRIPELVPDPGVELPPPKAGEPLIGEWFVMPFSDAFDAVGEEAFSDHPNPDNPNEIHSNNYKARSITILPLPAGTDLAVTSVVPDAVGRGGDAYTVRWTVANVGHLPTKSSGWVDAVWLADAPDALDRGDSNLLLLGSFPRDGTLESGQSYTREQTFNLTPAAAGRYVIVQTFLGGLPLDDLDDRNNIRYAPTQVTNLPADLVVSAIELPLESFSGEEVLIQWTVENVGGPMWAGTRYWIDTVYISPDPVLILSRAEILGSFTVSPLSPLGAGDRYVQSQTVRLPRGAGGNFYMHVITDPRGKTELLGDNEESRKYYTTAGYENSANNSRSALLPIEYREPDLTVTDIAIPDAAHSGESIDIRWTVTNLGNRATRNQPWVDRVYLSSDPSLDLGDFLIGAAIAPSAELASGGSYAASINARLPDGVDGSFFVLVYADSNIDAWKLPPNPSDFNVLRLRSPDLDGPSFSAPVPSPYRNGRFNNQDDYAAMARTQEFANEGNNIASRPLQVVLTPPPDLVVEAIAVPQSVVAGERFDVTYTVANRGGDTPSTESTWSDLVYLSRDPYLDVRSDRYITAGGRSTGLVAGETYTSIVEMTAPSDLNGPFYVIVLTDPIRLPSAPRGDVFELDRDANNANHSPQPVIFTLPPPVDLQVDPEITFPRSAQSGEMLTVDWRVSNNSDAIANGTWSDALYLSRDGIWDINDVPLARVSVGQQSLANGESYQGTFAAEIPPLTPGQYRIIVRTDVLDQVHEGEQEANNVTASADVIEIGVEELHLGVPLTLTLAAGRDRLYQIHVAQDQTLRVSVSSDAQDGANELFLRFNEAPTGIVYDAAYEGALGPNQTVVIPSTQPGTYYVLLRGIAEPTPAPQVTLLAEVLPFHIADVIPDTGGDGHWVTTTILGARFDQQAIVRLVRPDIAEFAPASYEVVDSTKIIATFDLRDAPHGLYDIKVINPDGAQAIVPYRYLVERAIEPDVRIGLGGPRTISVRGTPRHGQFTVTVENLGNLDTPYTYLQVGIPELGTNVGLFNLPYLQFASTIGGAPPADALQDRPWASLAGEINLNGLNLAPGYILDLPNRRFARQSFTAFVYPGLETFLPPWGKWPTDDPEEFSFRFPIVAAATAMSRDEFVAQQRQEALKLRGAILADPSASTSLKQLAFDSESWANLYLAALIESQLLRPVDQAPPIEQDPAVVSLMATLASGILAGPAGREIVTGEDVVAFFAKIREWYGDDSGLIYRSLPPNVELPDADEFDLGLTLPTHFESFNIYALALGRRSEWLDSVAVPPPDFSAIFDVSPGSLGQFATIEGPFGYGPTQIVPADQRLPYTINFSNPSTTTASGEIRIVTKLDPNLDPRTFQPGDMTFGGITVHIPSARGLFQGDFDFTREVGFILRITAGVDIGSTTATWLVQAIDPATGEVERNPQFGLLASGATGFVSYSALPKSGLSTRTKIAAQARVLLDNAPPTDADRVEHLVDGAAPQTALTIAPLGVSGTDYEVSWKAVDDAGGSGVKHVTVYFAENGGDFRIWKRQSTETSGIFTGEPGKQYEFLALATDNAGNQEQPPLGLTAPDDGSSVNLGTTPQVGDTQAPDLGPPREPSPQPSTNPLFIEALQNIPSATGTRPTEFASVVRPFQGSSFALCIPQSLADIGPMAILVLPDRTVLASGGPGRNQLFRFDEEGGPAGDPLVTLPYPVFDLALDANGRVWATSGGGPLLEIDPASGQIFGEFGDSLTQSLAIDPSSGRIYVSSGSGIEVFDPVTEVFSHYSDVRVGGLAFAPDGSLWAAIWPSRGDIIRFDDERTPEVMLRFDTSVDSIAFGIPGSLLEGLLFVSNNSGPRAGIGSELTMVDLATLRSVAIAAGGSRGDILETTPDGRVLLSQSHQIDVLNPLLPPRVIRTNPPPDGIVALPFGRIAITFDQDMLQADASDPRSVLNLQNYQLVGNATGPVTIRTVVYSDAGRTAYVYFESPNVDEYELRVSDRIESREGLGLDEAAAIRFTAVSDFSAFVDFAFDSARSSRGDRTIAYDIRITNTSEFDLILPLHIVLSSTVDFDGQPVDNAGQLDDGSWLVDLRHQLPPDGRLRPHASTVGRTIVVLSPAHERVPFEHGVVAFAAPNQAPQFESTPLSQAITGTAFAYHAAAIDPDGAIVTYVLVSGPHGMAANPITGLVSWLPTDASPAKVTVVLQAYDIRGGHATQEFTVVVAGGNQAPVFTPLPTEVRGVEGTPLELVLSVNDPDDDPLSFSVENLPAGASFDPARQLLIWTPGFDAAGTYEDVRFIVRDGVNEIVLSTTLLIAPENQAPHLSPPPNRVIREGDAIRFQLLATDGDLDALTYSTDFPPGGAFLDANTGDFEWTPRYFQHGVYEIPFSVTDGTHTTTHTTTITVLNVNAPPVFDELGRWRAFEGQALRFRAFAGDPDNPAFIPPDRTRDGSLTPLEGTLPTVQYMADDLPPGATFDPETAMFAWTPGFGATGVYSISFTATDDGDGAGAGLSSTRIVPIEIVNSNRPPEIVPIENQTIGRGNTLDIPIQATDADGNSIVLQVVNAIQGYALPEFMMLTDVGDGAGTLRVAPGIGDRGVYTVSVRATDDGDGEGVTRALTGEFSFVITILSPNEPPHFNHIGDKVALVGETLQFTVFATDLDEDPLSFAAIDMPPGATISAGSTYGTANVSFTPNSSQQGTYPVTFRVSDSGNGNPTLAMSDEVTVDLVVRPSNAAPTLLPVADQVVSETQTLELHLSAVDPDGDSLSYSATNLSPGASLDGATGVLSWTPNIFQSGIYSGIELQVTDGNKSSAHTIQITVQNTNQAPLFLAILPQGGMEGERLTISLPAADVDGDALLFTRNSALPQGMAFNATTGALQWTPSFEQAGFYVLEFTVADFGGLSDSGVVSIVIDNVNHAPTLSVSSHSAALGQLMQFQLVALDSDLGTTLTYAAQGLPAGATLNASTGAFSWTPGPAQAGEYPVVFSVSDGEATTQRGVLLRAALDPTPPAVTLDVTPSFPAVPGQKVRIQVIAASLAPVVSLNLTVNGQAVALDSQGRAEFTPSAPGKFAIDAKAIDADGLVGLRSAVVKVRDPNDSEAPQLFLDDPLNGLQVRGITDIVGTVADANLDFWRLEWAYAGTNDFQLLASGEAPAANQLLATLDPGQFANGFYRLRLTATDVGRRTSSIEAALEINTSDKPAQLQFAQTDLTVTLGGATINLVREYDSLNRNLADSFGFGWRLVNRDVQLRTNVPSTGREEQGEFAPFMQGTRVFVKLPDGRNAGYTFAPQEHALSGVTFYTPAFIPDMGVDYALDSAAATLSRARGRFYDLLTAAPYNPASGLFGVTHYRLTALDGTVYLLDTHRGVREQITPAGIRLAYGDNGISAASGERIQFLADGLGRLAAIIAPDNRQVVYTYDSAGNLVSVRNLGTGQSHRFGYEAQDRHLLSIKAAPAGEVSEWVQYAPTVSRHPVKADLGSAVRFVGAANDATLSTGETDRFVFSLRSSELASSPTGAVLVGIEVTAAAGSSLQPAIPLIPGVSPLQTFINGGRAYALYSLDRDGLHLFEVSAGTTAGMYSVNVSIVGDVNLDGRVDGVDGGLLSNALGAAAGSTNYVLGADTNRDGAVNLTDQQFLGRMFGFAANQAPSAANSDVLTHEDLEVTFPLSGLATDPEGDSMYCLITSATHGAAQLSPDGRSVIFVPEPGYTGPASFDYRADDGYSASSVARVMVNVSAAPLISLEFGTRAPLLTFGESFELEMFGDFADQVGVALPASYLAYSTSDSTVATVSAQGIVSAAEQLEGFATILVSSHGIQAATAVKVADPESEYADLDYLGLEVYPVAMALPAAGGTRKVIVTIDGILDVTELIEETAYYVANPNIVQVDDHGVVTALASGTTTVTVIHAGQEFLVPVIVEAPHEQSAILGAAGGVVRAIDGSLVQVAPGALLTETNVQIAPLAEAALPMPVPAWLEFAGAVQLHLEDQELASPVQLAVRAPATIPPGSAVNFYAFGSIPDANGLDRPVWLQYEVGVVGDDGFARTTSPPFPGFVRTAAILVGAAKSALLSVLSFDFDEVPNLDTVAAAYRIAADFPIAHHFFCKTLPLRIG